MQASIRSDGTILQIGDNIGELPDATNYDIPDVLATNVRKAMASMRPMDSLRVTRDGVSVAIIPGALPTITTTPAPNIEGIIAALINSASLDKSTKDNLIAALRGN